MMGAGYFVASAPSRQLTRFLREISRVEIGKTSWDDWCAEVVRAKISNVDFQCNQQECSAAQRLKNGILAPPSAVLAEVAFQNGVASQIYVAFATQSRKNERIPRDDKGVVIRAPSGAQSCKPVYYARQRNQSGEHFWVDISMNSRTEQDDWTRALAINTRCLTKIGGCRSIEEIAPEAFRSDPP